MKIALLTIWHEKNYGAELQAYATVQILTSLGHDVRMIDIRLSDKNRLTLKNHITNFIESFGPCHKKFDSFWKKYIPTTKRYKTIEELQTDPPKADIYMVGSDQVWNPDITKEFYKLYFLNFGDDSIRRISYASSFGQPEVHFKDHEEVQSLLKRFSDISCREKSGVEILAHDFGILAQQVIDPCLLLDSYSNFIQDTTANGTLCYYPLSEDKELESYSEQLANRINLKAVNMNKSTKLLKKIVWDRPSIEEWLNNIAHSNFILTRSFHGIVFSLIFQKQFVVLVGKNNRTTRLETLLSLFNLEDRLFSTISEIENKRPWEKEIDYTLVSQRMKEVRDDALRYLIKNVGIKQYI